MPEACSLCQRPATNHSALGTPSTADWDHQAAKFAALQNVVKYFGDGSAEATGGAASLPAQEDRFDQRLPLDEHPAGGLALEASAPPSADWFSLSPESGTRLEQHS